MAFLFLFFLLFKGCKQNQRIWKIPYVVFKAKAWFIYYLAFYRKKICQHLSRSINVLWTSNQNSASSPLSMICKLGIKMDNSHH